MLLQLQQIVENIEEGSYSGWIKSCSVSQNGEYIWFKIKLDNTNFILNTSLPIAGKVFNDFAVNFVDENGNLDTKDFLNVNIDFSVVDRKINEKVYSKIIKIIPKEEVDNG